MQPPRSKSATKEGNALSTFLESSSPEVLKPEGQCLDLSTYMIVSFSDQTRTKMVSPRACFYPDGSAAPKMVPCNPAATESACCGYNDTCIAHGMCLSNDIFFYRGACTSTSYPASCPQSCIKSNEASKYLNALYFHPEKGGKANIKGANSLSGFQPLSICQDLAINPVAGAKLYTCSSTSANCIRGNFSLTPGPVVATNVTGFPTSAASNATCKKSGVSTTGLWVAVAVPVVAILIAAAVLFVWEHRKRVKAENSAKNWESTAQRVQMEQMTGKDNPTYQKSGKPLNAEIFLSELSGHGR